MLEKIMEAVTGAGTGVYILWGMGLLGLLLKIMMNTYLKGMVKASENMATTKRKSLRIIRQKYENGKSLGINNGNGEAYVEKNVRKLKLVALPMEFWRKSGQALCCLACMTMAGAFLYYDVSWRGSPDMISFMANGVMVCAFLLVLENIFLINNKLEILKANIRDYLENIPSPRELSARAPARFRNDTGRGRENADCKQETGGKSSGGGERETAATEQEIGRRDRSQTETDAVSDLPANGNEEILNSFLKEFFS